MEKDFENIKVGKTYLVRKVYGDYSLQVAKGIATLGEIIYLIEVKEIRRVVDTSEK